MGSAARPSSLVRDVLPEFYVRVVTAMLDEGHPDLAAQMPDLAIDHLCGCGQSDCATFLCVPKQPGALRGSTTTDIHGDFGEALVDVSADGRILGFELLGWNELRPSLHAWASRSGPGQAMR